MVFDDIWWYTWCFIVHAILFSHPHIETGLSRASWQDAYYLLEIDPWGRRFYHRGGMRTGAAGDVAFSGGSGSTYSERRVQGATNLRHFFIFIQPCHDRSNTFINWLVLWNIWIIFPFSWECRHPNWRNSYFSEGYCRATTNQLYMVHLTIYGIYGANYILSSLTIYGIYHDIYS